MHIKQRDLSRVMMSLELLGQTKHPLYRIHHARAINHIKPRLEEFEMAIRPSKEYQEYESEHRRLLSKHGKLVGFQMGREQFTVEPDKRKEFDVALEELMTRFADAILDERDRESEIEALGKQTVEVPVKSGYIKYHWIKDLANANEIAPLMEYGLLDDASIDKALTELEKREEQEEAVAYDEEEGDAGDGKKGEKDGK